MLGYTKYVCSSGRAGEVRQGGGGTGGGGRMYMGWVLAEKLGVVGCDQSVSSRSPSSLIPDVLQGPAEFQRVASTVAGSMSDG